MINNYLEEKWEYLRGSQEEFSFENRMVNSISVITFAMLSMLLIFNIVMSLFDEAFISVAVLMLDGLVYYLSRFRKQYRTSIAIYVAASYVALFFVYYYNSGLYGPTLFFFFLTFQVIATVTPKKHHLIWALLHVCYASTLCFIEYRFPDFIVNGYTSREARFIDIVFTFVMCLFFVYLVTMHLRNNLDRIRKKSQARAEEIECHLHEIEAQNEKLKEISWLQSHKVRSQVATILGLSQFVNQGNIEDPDLNMVIGGIKEAAKELDDVIREINRLTNSADINK
jgi:two-component system sensor histidine kinase/response regulator